MELLVSAAGRGFCGFARLRFVLSPTTRVSCHNLDTAENMTKATVLTLSGVIRRRTCLDNYY